MGEVEGNFPEFTAASREEMASDGYASLEETTSEWYPPPGWLEETTSEGYADPEVRRMTEYGLRLLAVEQPTEAETARVVASARTPVVVDRDRLAEALAGVLTSDNALFVAEFLIESGAVTTLADALRNLADDPTTPRAGALMLLSTAEWIEESSW